MLSWGIFGFSGTMTGSMTRWNQHLDWLPERLLAAVAKDLLRTFVKESDPLRLVDADDRIGRNYRDTCQNRVGNGVSDGHQWLV